MLEIRVAEDGRIELDGRFDASQVEKAQEAFSRVERGVVVDFADLDYISSAGLGVLFATQRRLLGVGGGLKLVNLDPHIREVFRIAGFDAVFEIE
jgi:anti-sigma B factor antagonist